MISRRIIVFVRHDLSYLAGLIDGEGHFYKPLITNGRGEKRYYPRLVITNTNKELIDWLKANYGGHVQALKKIKQEHTQCYQWVLTGKRVQEIASSVLPYLIVKKEQIKRVL